MRQPRGTGTFPHASHWCNSGYLYSKAYFGSPTAPLGANDGVHEALVRQSLENEMSGSTTGGCGGRGLVGCSTKVGSFEAGGHVLDYQVLIGPYRWEYRPSVAVLELTTRYGPASAQTARSHRYPFE